MMANRLRLDLLARTLMQSVPSIEVSAGRRTPFVSPASHSRHLNAAGVVLAFSLAALFFASASSSAQVSEGSVEGTVKAADGAPLSGAIVSATGPVRRSEMTDPDGRYTVSKLEPGIYSVMVTRPGYLPNKQADVEVKPGSAIEVDLTLTPAPNETVIVTASRMQADLQSSPATASVIPAADISSAPATNVGDLLRSVPGLNVMQTSARDINLASRQASPTLTNSQIALIDGRTIYSDFFDIIFWDLVPVSYDDIKQVEVVRGPVSAVWGANATTGAVNIITKTPRESQGLTLSLTGGAFSRDAGSTAGQGPGGLAGANIRLAQAINDRWAYRLSAGYDYSDAFPRPTGQVPISTSPVDPSVVVGGGSLDQVLYPNVGTKQPRFDLRVDQEFGTSEQISYEAGIAGSQGIIQTPIGPFSMQPGSYLGYGRVGYLNGGLRLSVFANLLNGQAPNLLTPAADGGPLWIYWRTGTYDISGSYTQLVGSHHLLNYGGNFRYNSFDISVAPTAKNRNEGGGYIEDEILLGRLRLPLSLRVDKLSNLSQFIFSPRAAVVYQLTDSQSVRFSYNRAHRSPSAIDNFLDISIIGGYLPLGLIDPSLNGQQFPIVTQTLGNTDLKPETLTAWEIGYTGTLRWKTALGLAFYLNNSNNVISNNGSPAALIASGVPPYYTSQNPPPGWPLPPEVIDLLALQGIFLPATVMTLNLGEVRNKGFEVSVHQPFGRFVNTFVNYSYQAIPETLSPLTDPYRYPPGALAAPPRNRFNTGVNVNGKRFFGNASVNYAGKAFWTDAIQPSYYGYSGAYTLVNGTIGVRWSGNRVITSLRAVNLLNQDVQQYIFGDILKRKIYGEVQFNF